MNKKGVLLIIIIIVSIVLFFSRGGETSYTIKDSELSVGKIKVIHVFVDGTHTFSGEINLPTPCHSLSQKVVIAESYPEQVTAAFEIKSGVDSCVQMIIPEPFIVSFKASKEANFKITLNNKDIPFEIIEVEKIVEVFEENATTTVEELNEEGIIEKESATSTEELENTLNGTQE